MGDRLREKINVPLIVQPEDRIVYFPESIAIGNFLLNTNPTTGAIEVKPTEVPTQTPAPAAQPVSLVLDASGIVIQSTAEYGGRVVLEALLNNLLDTELSLEGLGRMPLRSLFGSILSRVSAAESNIADISGVRLAAEEAKSALNDITDAMQDVSGALLALSIATAASDISGVLTRVAALESAPGFDSAPLLASIADLSGVAHLAATTATGAAADVLVASAAIADLSGNVRGRVDAVEAWNAGSRLDTVESAVASKVAQADYDLVVAALQTSVASKVAQADYDTAISAINTSLAGKAEAADLAAKADASAVEAKGYFTSMEADFVSYTGINGAYWGGLTQSVRISALAGKLVVVDYNDAPVTVALEAGAGSAGQVVRIRNGGSTHPFTVEMGSQESPIAEVEIQAGETVTLRSNGSTWVLV